MILYSLWLYTVDSRHLAQFMTAFREGGIGYETFRCIPGHIHTDLLGRTGESPDQHRLLSLSFFTSQEALLRAERSAEMQEFVQWLDERTRLCLCLGTYSILPQSAADIPSAGQPGKEFARAEMHG